MAEVGSTLASWSSTDASNSPSGATTIGTGLDDNLRAIQGVLVRGLSHKGSDIAATTTTDVGAVEGMLHDITGTEAITGLGTVRAGIWKFLKFEGVNTLTHNATSLILPGAADITTADGDVGIFMSEGSGNWRCLHYMKANGAVLGSVLLSEVTTTGSAVVSLATTIPPWAKKITLLLEGCSSSGTSPWIIQIGPTGGVESTSYVSDAVDIGAAGNAYGNTTAGFLIHTASNAGASYNGKVEIELKDAANNTWEATSRVSRVGTNVSVGVGAKSLAGVLTQVSITTTGGSDTFDAMSIAVKYE